PCFTHPVLITHPETKKRALYVNRLLTREIAGMDQADSRALLGKLFDVIERDEFQYDHKWRPGDFVMWDNRCTQHGRTDFDPAERRLLRRLTVTGERPAA
ncbi:MAG: TauD/TfdA family dioxygenase, partial [Alphaproteobacteria bacterium]